MKNNLQSGFSLIELLLVVTILGIIAAVGVPSLQKGIRAADNGATFALMRSISSAQLSYFSQNNRYARLSELNALQTNAFGKLDCGGNCLIRGRFIIEMSPLTPTNEELKNEYSITATERYDTNGIRYKFNVIQSGEVVQVTP